MVPVCKLRDSAFVQAAWAMHFMGECATASKDNAVLPMQTVRCIAVAQSSFVVESSRCVLSTTVASELWQTHYGSFEIEASS